MIKVKKIDIDSNHLMELFYYTEEATTDLSLIIYRKEHRLFSVVAFPTPTGKIQVELNIYKKKVNVVYVYLISLMLVSLYKRIFKLC